MIRYSLACGGCGHAFDSLFDKSAEYDRLKSLRLLECPQCGGFEVNKALMAPAIGKSTGAQPAKDEASGTGGQKPPMGALPESARETLRKLRRQVQAHGENVGNRFVEEARKMGSGEAPERLVYGDATPEEARRLREEGLPIVAVPWVPLDDA